MTFAMRTEVLDLPFRDPFRIARTEDAEASHTVLLELEQDGATGLGECFPVPYYGETLHPVGLYRAVGLTVALAWIWTAGDAGRPGRIVLQAIFGYSVVRLIADAAVAEAALTGSLRTSQVLAFAAALASSLALALTARPAAREETTAEAAEDEVSSPQSSSSS